MSLRTKFIVYLLLLGITPLLIFYFMSIQIQNSTTQVTLNKEIQKIEKIMENSFGSNLNEIANVCRITAASSEVKNAILQNNTKILASYIKGMEKALNTNGDYRFLIIGKDSKVFYNAKEPNKIGWVEDNGDVQDALNGNSSTGYLKTPEGYGAYAFYPIYDGSKIIGVTEIGTPLNSSYLESIKKLTGENICIYHGGILTASTDPDKQNILGNEIADKEFNLVKSGKEHIKDRGNGIYSTYFPLKDGDTVTGMAETDIDLTSLVKIANRSHTTYIMGITIAVILTVIFAILIAGSVTRPIERLSKKIEKLGNGDLTIDFDEKNSKDEIGKMAHSLTTMAKKLRELMKLVSDASLDMSSKSEELASSMDSNNKNMEMLMNTSVKINGNAESASAATEEVTASGEEVASASQSVADSSQKLADKAENLSAVAKEGTTLVEDINKMINESVDEGNKTVKIVDALNDNAKNVEEIINVIDGISEQTSLLALNAAIEAARAGESGKGFAVIADEIRGLAEDSKKSTKKIADILTKIQEGVINTTRSTKSTIESIATVESKMREIYKMFSTIDEDVDEIMGMSSNMAAAAEEESASSEEIASAMESASGAIVDITNQLAKMHEVIKSQSEMNDEINRVSTDLSRLAEVVEEKVNAFKIV